MKVHSSMTQPPVSLLNSITKNNCLIFFYSNLKKKNISDKTRKEISFFEYAISVNSRMKTSFNLIFFGNAFPWNYSSIQFLILTQMNVNIDFTDQVQIQVLVCFGPILCAFHNFQSQVMYHDCKVYFSCRKFWAQLICSASL